jgi:hypothetical protein
MPSPFLSPPRGNIKPAPLTRRCGLLFLEVLRETSVYKTNVDNSPEKSGNLRLLEIGINTQAVDFVLLFVTVFVTDKQELFATLSA